MGDGTGEPVEARLADTRAVLSLLLQPELRTGELFTDGRLVMIQGTIYDFLCLVLSQPQERASGTARAIERIRQTISLWGQRNDPGRSRRNVAHHYDLGDAFYSLFLDPDWQYSCAYFEHPGQSLADAQLAKKRHIAAKMVLRPGDRVLDIGCGWGGMALYLAGVAKVGSVVGVTLSDEQLARAQARAVQQGVEDLVEFRLQDYRAVPETFDRIVSVGMFEHVGLKFYEPFFDTCRDRLTEDGVMLLHTIGSSDEPTTTNPWLTRYIFPGGHLPSLSDMTRVIERAGLIVTDVEVLRLHYAATLRAWRVAFMASRTEACAMFDERFCRMWEFYLSMAEAAFRYEDIVIFQIQIARSQETVPLTRRYIDEAETRLRDRETSASDSAPAGPGAVVTRSGMALAE
ncbi:cyclopropane-fatty-acyl-phospholipid synthase family protein [uncultured Brevundimonas sp.]|uniref:cyclopropane-fatty-acyl-phospholipid synthase family protein n=1 Tax=uncultured Brevundimonas sp. TaxID=213418 RepID=UPI0030EE8068